MKVSSGILQGVNAKNRELLNNILVGWDGHLFQQFRGQNVTLRSYLQEFQNSSTKEVITRGYNTILV